MPKQELPNIFSAAMMGNVGALKNALEYSDVNATDDSGMTALHYAASSLAVDAIDLLLDHPNIDPTISDDFGRSAATIAYECHNVFSMEVVKKLTPHCYPWLYSEPNSPEPI